MGIANNINIGAADLFFIPPSGTDEVYLGMTKGGGEFAYETEWHDVSDIDQYGKTIVDSILIGEKVSYKTNLVDTSLDSIDRMSPTGAPMKQSTVIKAIGFGQLTGLRLSDNCGKLRIHPIAAGLTDRSHDVIIYKAANKGKLNLSFKLEEEWIVPVEIIGLPDDSRPNGDQMFRVGEEGYALTAPVKRVVLFQVTPSNSTSAKSAVTNFKAFAYYYDGTSGDVTTSATWSVTPTSSGTIVAGTGVFTANTTAGTVAVSATWSGMTSTTNITVS